MPNAVLIIERITCLKLYRQVFQGLKAHCYSQRLSLFFALLFSCVCSDCDAVGVTFLPTSANLTVISIAPSFYTRQAYSVHSACCTFSVFLCKFYYCLLFLGFLCYYIHQKLLPFGIWFCGKNIIPYLEVNFSFYWVTSF